MASHDSAHRRNRSTPHPQSIPLRDLSQQPDTRDGRLGVQAQRRRTLSDRGRELLRNRNSFYGRGGDYVPIAERSPSPTRRDATIPRTFLTIPDDTHHASLPHVADELSPLADRAGFQEAIGFAGLSFEGDSSSDRTPGRPAAVRGDSLSSLTSRIETGPSNAPDELEGTQDYAPADGDTTPLTQSSHLHPVHSGIPTTPTGQRRSRTSFQSVRFLSPDGGTSPGSRLGDDLHNIEAGLGASGGSSSTTARSRKRSLSPSAAESPLRRAGTIVRNISQRVVNLSNEPEVLERTRRRSSVKQPRLEDFPTIPELATDGAASIHTGPEQAPSPVEERPEPDRWDTPEEDQPEPNPLRGSSLGLFPPDSKLRLKLCDLLVHPFTEPFIFILIVIQTILLAVDSRRSVYLDPRSEQWGTSPIDYILLVLFSIYTVEIIMRIIVSGFIINPLEYSTINRQIGWRRAVMNQVRSLFAPHRHSVSRDATAPSAPQGPSILRSFTTNNVHTDIPGSGRQQRRVRLAHRAFLRHSFNRLDFVAVVAFWISFGLGITGLESSKNVYVFRMLSCLRILRLLGLTSGTTVILRSLKKAAPLLVNVAFLISFFWLLFAIIGVQSFKSSLRRNCVWINPDNSSDTYTNNFTFCGGYIDNTGLPQPWLLSDGKKNGMDGHKGYLCPQGSVCLEGDNPYNGTVSFDNLLQSLELVFVIMTSNTFSDLMYYLMASDYLAAALFFAAGIVILSLWLINLLIAVITSSFQIIRDESKNSAFTTEEPQEPKEDQEQKEGAMSKPHMSSLRSFYEKTHPIWIAVILYSIICQCLRDADMSKTREKFIDASETVVTLVLLVEIVIRFAADWRGFFRSKQNIFDLGLAVITTIIQFPPIHNSGQAYAWLTIFQILRFYRVVMAWSITRDLITLVLGNVSGLLNLILFVFLLTFLAAIFAAQIFRGDMPQSDSDGDTIKITFFTIYNSFLGMYQILSSENWTSIMYNITTYDFYRNTAWIGAAFCIIWFILGNFIVLNMFIAVIQENFDVSEDEKRLKQVEAFLQHKELGHSSQGNLSLSTIFKFGLATGRRKDPLAFGSAMTEMLLKEAVVRDFLDDHDDSGNTNTPDDDTQPMLQHAPTVVYSGQMSSWWGRIVSRLGNREPNPFYSQLQFSRAYEELDPRQKAKEVVTARERRKRAQRDYLRRHPSYNTSLFIFKPGNPIRKLCQRIVGPGRGGDRIEGVAPSAPIWYTFSAFIYAAIVAMVLLACITTPLYQKLYFEHHKFSVRNWFVYTDLGFAVLFTVEAIIKIIADGFFWTPHAYFRSSWGLIDAVVLITLWINVGTALFNEGQVSRAVGAFKALRALRLLNVSDSAKNTFHSVIVLGGIKVLSAAFVSLSLLIPFAVYGLNLFRGKLQTCNDTGFLSGSDLSNCVGEYTSSPFNPDWNMLAPRQVSNPYYDFDNFGHSLFILFQIVSQEGWVDVMWAAQSITGVFKQPAPYASQGNAVFFVVFNLLGAVFVLTLFVSVFMRNYTEQTGVAFLTTEQRSWLELRKLLRQVSPSKRPLSTKKRETWEEWCYKRAIRKTGRWQRFVTGILAMHLVLLCLEWYPEPFAWDRTRDYIFLGFTLFYIANIAIRIIGLTWARFRRSSWDIYSLFAVAGTFVTTVLLLSNFKQKIYVQLHKLCLVAIALLLIPRNNQLDQLFKTAAASLTSIANLLATWFVLFLVYAIALTQTFGLTAFNTNETGNLNFRSVPKALILLFRMSVGEGWNQIMEDFATVVPPKCIVGDQFRDGDCGSPEWARALFISWNILSMYIFVNLFVSLIYESFSYVYQRSSGLSVISREEIRRFKEAWAEFDPNGTGYISKEKFPRLLGELSGVFEMRIYDGDFTVARIIEDCRVERRRSQLPVEAQHEETEIDVKKLNERLATLPIREIRKRRDRMNKFYEEVLVSSDPDRGIGFSALLMILAHYKVINDNKSLRLEEFLRRRARLQRVEEAVRRNVVIGFFDTIYWSRHFRRHLETKRAGRMTAIPQFTVPEIFVEDDADTRPAPHDSPSHSPAPSIALTPVETASSGGSASGADVGEARTPPLDTGSAAALRSRANSIQVTPSSSPTGASPFPSPSSQAQQHHRPSRSDVSADWQFAAALGPGGSRPVSPLQAESPDAGRSRANSAVSAQEVLDVLDNSAWGESIRRSFTIRRPSGGSGQ